MFQQLLLAVFLPTLALSLPGKQKAADVTTSTRSSLPTAVSAPVLSEPEANKLEVEEEYDPPAPVLRATKPRGYASKEEMNAAMDSWYDLNKSEAEEKEVDRRLIEYFDDEAEKKHREAGLPGKPRSCLNPSGYANSRDACAGYRSKANTRAEREEMRRRTLLFRCMQMKIKREVDERRGRDIVINLAALPANIKIVYERFMTKPVDGEDAYNSFVEFFELQRNGLAPRRSSMMDNFLIAVAQYEMRSLMVPDTATNAMNSVLYNLDVARLLGRDYIAPGCYFNRSPGHSMYGGYGAFSSTALNAAFARSRVGPSLTISYAKTALAIDESNEVTVDVVEAAFKREADIMVAEGVRDIGATSLSITALKNFRQARSLLLRSLE
jgi:hypothetical protein